MDDQHFCGDAATFQFQNSSEPRSPFRTPLQILQHNEIILHTLVVIPDPFSFQVMYKARITVLVLISSHRRHSTSLL